MGTLIAKYYHIAITADLADHTYVSCCDDDAKAWKCWGGKTGGTKLRTGSGSTKRANEIASPDEKSGITCYAINGVCHQAANRILITAGITVEGVRGYRVSSTLFGVYGRPRGILGFCDAPFYKHELITGDIKECLECEKKNADNLGAMESMDDSEEKSREISYLNEVLRLYEKGTMIFSEKTWESDHDEVVDFQSKMFQLALDHYLPEEPNKASKNDLLDVRQKTEVERLEIESRLLQNEMDPYGFIESMNGNTVEFQRHMTDMMDDKDYEALFDLKRGDEIIVIDGEIAGPALDKLVGG